MSLAAPVVRGDFVYNGDLYIDVGNLNRHKRATVAEITDLLRPDLANSKTSLPTKDKVGHWYEAQLVHYGLPPSKNKATAKLRLLDNLNKSQLTVPSHIIAIESELKKEFASSERKAKALHKKESASAISQEVQSITNKKRKQPEKTDDGSGINMNSSLHMGSPTNSGPAVNQTSPDEPIIPRKQTARRSNGWAVTPPALSRAAVKAKAASATQPKKYATKQTARRGGAVPARYFPPIGPEEPIERSRALHQDMSGGRFSLLNGDSDSNSPKKKTKTENAPTIKKRLSTKAEPKIKKEPKVKKEDDPHIKTKPGAKGKGGPKLKQEPKSTSTKVGHSTAPCSLGLINGIYDITCEDISGEWSTGPLTLTLTLDSPGVWGAYDFGMFEGILRLAERPWAVSDTCSLMWRGRENGEGEMNFDDGSNQGYIDFLGNGEIEGALNLYGNCDFTGRRRNGPGTPVRTAASMRQEWDGYNQEAYDRENRSRWGGGW